MKNPRTLAALLSGSLWVFLGRWFDKKDLSTLAESCYRAGEDGAGTARGEAAFRLSQIYLARGRNNEAAEICERALRRDEKDPRIWCALGAARRRLAHMDPAREAFEKAVALDPSYASAWNNLGEWWLVKDEPLTALNKFDRALEIDPRLLQALNNRVAALYELGRFADAEEMARAAIESYPNQAALHANLGNILLHTGKSRLAAKAFQTALDCDVNCPEAQLGLSMLLGETVRLAATVEYRKQEIAVKGENAQRLADLAVALHSAGDRAAAQATCEKILSFQSNNISALITLAACLSAKGDHRHAIEYNLRALEQNPDMPGIYSNIAFESTYLADATADEVFGFHREWASRFETGTYREKYTFVRPTDADRPLRIGYVSGDFSTHPVGFLIRDVVISHDHARFRIYCYSMMRSSDAITDAIRENADVWVDALFMTDDELADRIHEDQVDILIDLSGHTAYTRLPVFVRKPAPIQATWIGYFHSTGLETIDYYITDPFTTPERSAQLFSETPVWLPSTRFCYSPPAYAPSVTPSPVLKSGQITFGSFNRVEKLVDPVITSWVEILNRVPGSRLLLKAGVLSDEAVCTELRRKFTEKGLEASRLELRASSPHHDMLAQYGEVDIALDPFPFNGGMTTLEALWMGVPVVTLAGDSVVSRQSTSALSNIGLQELIFNDLQSYIQGAVSLAGNVEALSTLRREMRGRMSHSPLCQPEQFTLDLEALYRRMWDAWCKGEKLGKEIVKGKPASLKNVLHVGCGPADIRSLPRYFQRGWRETRLDIDPSVAPDVVASMLDMSAVPDQSVDAVFSSHNIEHLHPHEVNVALREFLRVLKPDGVLVLTCPDLQPVCELVAKDQLDDMAYMSPAGPISPIDMLYGHRAAMERGNLFMAHKTGFTARTLKRSLMECGFAAVEVGKGLCFDLWAVAYPSPVDDERIATDKALCFPKREV